MKLCPPPNVSQGEPLFQLQVFSSFIKARHMVQNNFSRIFFPMIQNVHILLLVKIILYRGHQVGRYYALHPKASWGEPHVRIHSPRHKRPYGPITLFTSSIMMLHDNSHQVDVAHDHMLLSLIHPRTLFEIVFAKGGQGVGCTQKFVSSK